MFGAVEEKRIATSLTLLAMTWGFGCFDENRGMGQTWDDKREKVWYNSIIQKGQDKDLLQNRSFLRYIRRFV